MKDYLNIWNRFVLTLNSCKMIIIVLISCLISLLMRCNATKSFGGNTATAADILSWYIMFHVDQFYTPKNYKYVVFSPRISLKAAWKRLIAFRRKWDTINEKYKEKKTWLQVHHISSEPHNLKYIFISLITCQTNENGQTWAGNTYKLLLFFLSFFQRFNIQS